MAVYLWIKNRNCSGLGWRSADGIHEIELKGIIINFQVPLDFDDLFHFCFFLVKLNYLMDIKKYSVLFFSI